MARRTYTRRPLEDRFWEKVEKSDDGCWLWVGAGAPGYGRIIEDNDARRMLMAHRLSYEMHIGPIPEGLTIDHLCRVPACVRPDHLEPVTQAENVRRADVATDLRSAVTHCPQGHEYTEANTYRYTNAKGITRRACRQCRSNRSQAKNSAKRPHWESVVDPDGVMPLAEAKRLAAEAKREHHRQLGQASASARRRKFAEMEYPPCEVAGCPNDAKAYKGGPCNMHYIRLRRKGSYE